MALGQEHRPWKDWYKPHLYRFIFPNKKFMANFNCGYWFHYNISIQNSNINMQIFCTALSPISHALFVQHIRAYLALSVLSTNNKANKTQLLARDEKRWTKSVWSQRITMDDDDLMKNKITDSYPSNEKLTVIWWMAILGWSMVIYRWFGDEGWCQYFITRELRQLDSPELFAQ